MLSIGDFAKAAGISTRTVRHYESLGLIRASGRGENNYRYFDRTMLEDVAKIRELQGLGFSLEEIGDVMSLGFPYMTPHLKDKLALVETDLSQLRERRDRLKNLLQISQRVETAQALSLQDRRVYMGLVKEQILEGIRARHGVVSEIHLDYLQRETSFYDSACKQEFLEAVRKCVQFARDRNLTLGPGRGSCPASVILYSLGFSSIDPAKYDLIPERLSLVPPDIHIDVEFERGQPFVNFCRDISATLSWGQINAFKMPLLDIINRVHGVLGAAIDYGEIADDDAIVLDHFRSGEIDKIFLFDYSPQALILKYETLLPEYADTRKIKEFLRAGTIESFRDVINIFALWRPYHPENIARINRYADAKRRPHRYTFLKAELQERLDANFGLIIYHEDIVQIIAAYTGWTLERSSHLRRDLWLRGESPDLERFKSLAPNSVFELVLSEAPWTYCKSHAMSFSQFTKQTSILKSLHQNTYYEAIAQWERQHGFVWDDIGIKLKGVSLLQN